MPERRRILVVEDDYLIAALIADAVGAVGWQVIGTARDLATALDSAAREDFDAAVLDVNLGGQAVYRVADVLDARKVPFVFVTGYVAHGLSQPYCERPLLAKPFRPGELLDTVTRLIAPAEAESLGLAIIVGARSAARGDRAAPLADIASKATTQEP
jgi:DNA-binding response OmpR family regulator